jgi:hypothetical protein
LLKYARGAAVPELATWRGHDSALERLPVTSGQATPVPFPVPLPVPLPPVRGLEFITVDEIKTMGLGSFD